MSSSFVTFLFLTCSLLLVTNALVERICPIQTIFQFGDSQIDTGNDILLNLNVRADQLPYGQAFPSGPTGRWSDGRVLADYLATAFGLPHLTASLNSGASSQNGINFAVAGATGLDLSFFSNRGLQILNNTVPLNNQLTWFQTYLNSTCGSQIECSRRVRRSLVVLGIFGSNDINNGLSQGRSIQEVQTYLAPLVQSITNGVREIHRLGAVNIVVPGLFPMGCWPFYLTVFATGNSSDYDSLGCLRNINQLAVLYNNMLQQSLKTLGRELRDASIIYSDYYNALVSILRPRSSDPRALQSCCGSGGRYNFDVNNLCWAPSAAGVPVCQNPSQHIYWDGIHFTQEAHRLMSRILVFNIRSKLKCI